MMFVNWVMIRRQGREQYSFYELMNDYKAYSNDMGETVLELPPWLSILIFLMVFGTISFIIARVFFKGRRGGIKTTFGTTYKGVDRQRIKQKKQMRNAFDKRVNAVRRQYQKFLLVCADSGMTYGQNVTSEDVAGFAEREYKSDIPHEIRDIYLPARYDPEYTENRSELSRMETLNTELKKRNQELKKKYKKDERSIRGINS